jgi:1-acyl-sn-glycerol-3-phosphate acyltransferase
MHWVYYFGRGLIRTLAFPFGGWQTVGRENIREKGPFLIVSNHLHVADPPILAASLPLKCVFMAKDELWENAWSRFWVENFGAFPVRENGADREAFRQTEKWFGRGISVVMFPEGGRSRSGRLQKALPGAAVIVARLGVPVLPVSITGTDKLRNIKRAFWHHPHLKVTIGEPFRPEVGNGRLTREQRRETIDSIMRKIAAMLPPEYRGVYDAETSAGN